jgi:hypothetical protein
MMPNQTKMANQAKEQGLPLNQSNHPRRHSLSKWANQPPPQKSSTSSCLLSNNPQKITNPQNTTSPKPTPKPKSNSSPAGLNQSAQMMNKKKRNL